MDKELEEYYRNRFDMMNSQGWSDLMDDIEGIIKSTNSIENIDIDKLRFRQGELSMLKWIKSIKDVSEQAFKDLSE